jgi:peroxiredoxin
LATFAFRFKIFGMKKVLFVVLIALLSACSKQPELPKTGIWRAVLRLQGQELPFNLEVVQDSANSVDVYMINAGERLLLDEVSIENDSVKINLHVFDAQLRAKNTGDSLNGFFELNYNRGYRIPFKAAYGQDYRFAARDKSAAATNFTGRYAVQFFNEKDTTKAVGIIKQEGNYAEGSFLTPSGDHRYLEGSVINDTLHLSTFDGNHAYLYRVTKLNDSTLSGEQWLGRSRYRKWAGIKNDKAQLADPGAITYLKPGFDKIEFKFPNVNGDIVSLTDDRYKGKVVIVQILGSWCPNCMDETKFLVPWYERNKERGVEVIGLAYERKPEFAYASERVKKMINRYKMPYEVLIAGVYDVEKASATLPQLNKVSVWPTTIFIGRDGKVKHIHTGYSGPGTGADYEEQVQRFNTVVNELLNEKSKL